MITAIAMMIAGKISLDELIRDDRKTDSLIYIKAKQIHVSQHLIFSQETTRFISIW